MIRALVVLVAVATATAFTPIRSRSTASKMVMQADGLKIG
jgi:hypothetical protein